jgi:uncharacterized protein GlcG (DUF336 family)
MTMQRIKELSSGDLDQIFRDATAAAREETKEANLAITGVNEHGTIVSAQDEKFLHKKKPGRHVA